jgi:NADH dehydrogenase
VEPFSADVSKPDTLRGAAEGCTAVIHITGIVQEDLPETTFEQVNVGGTENVLGEAERAGVARFVFISSLGADRGRSDYHRSKIAAEALVQRFSREWTILRPGNVYGPGDDVISLLFKMVRVLPAVPVVGNGDQKFQPIFYRDLGRAIVRSVNDPVAVGQVLELAGNEVVTTTKLIDKISIITDRQPVVVPTPTWLSRIGTDLSELLGGKAEHWLEQWGIPSPLNSSKLEMLLEENLIPAGKPNGLTEVYGITPTPLDEGLRTLADLTPELEASQGLGKMDHKTFFVDIEQSPFDAKGLMSEFARRIHEVMPIEFAAEPGTAVALEKGTTFTAALPGRGNIQIRVEAKDSHRITFATLEGHPLAGVVNFHSVDIPSGVRFKIETYTRSSNLFDWLAMKTVGNSLQDQNWVDVLRNVLTISGGYAPDGVQHATEALDDERAEAVEREVKEMIQSRKRSEAV